LHAGDPQADAEAAVDWRLPEQRHRYQRTPRHRQRRPASSPTVAGAPARRRPPTTAVPAPPSRRRRRRSTAARSPSNPTARTIPYRFGWVNPLTSGACCQLARCALDALLGRPNSAPWRFQIFGPV
jgi:hypothetical protein